MPPLILNTKLKSTVEDQDDCVCQQPGKRPGGGSSSRLRLARGAQQPVAPAHRREGHVEECGRCGRAPAERDFWCASRKLGPVNWHGDYVRTDKGGNFMERPRIALLLGTVIADGFIAVQAQGCAGQ